MSTKNWSMFSKELLDLQQLKWEFNPTSELKLKSISPILELSLLNLLNKETKILILSIQVM